jgi:hypothetical protein
MEEEATLILQQVLQETVILMVTPGLIIPEIPILLNHNQQETILHNLSQREAIQLNHRLLSVIIHQVQHLRVLHLHMEEEATVVAAVEEDHLAVAVGEDKDY